MKNPETLEELVDWINVHADRIYVRELVDGRYQSLPLTKLPVRLAIARVLTFILEGRVPVILLDPEAEDA